ncbi:MAG TPA: apolipoprotein N-acyltransferase [Pyrinomonadaceae bacterium]|nr:apolipoprotein N-acyltransferase [Pyrinomonadaceae bacterium]
MRSVSAKLARVQRAVSLDAPKTGGRREKFRAGVRACIPQRSHTALAVLSAFLLILSFPDFNLWPLAWVGLIPLLVAIARVARARQAFALGWLAGALFFYGSCWWLTHSMIHYGGLPRPLAYALLVPVVLIVGLLPATFALALARLRARWGVYALLAAPPLWAASEWARLGATGQLWNAIGYSQAFHPDIIQAATWGGVYAVGFFIVVVNAAVALLLLQRDARSFNVAVLALVVVGLVFLLQQFSSSPNFDSEPKVDAVVVAVQPNVSVNFGRSAEETAALVSRHLTMSASALGVWEQKQAGEDGGGDGLSSQSDDARARTTQPIPRVVVWPESPMNFAYANDREFQTLVGSFARAEHTSVIFNSLEPAPAGGAYNSAVMVNEAGRLVAQYDKIRLLPFGEYVPLPRWFPPAWLVSGIVGDFTPGANYTLLPIGATRVGVFICFESAFPSIARTFTDAGADVLINISNDGYLGQTPVLRQHLANAVLRAVENRRPVLRVTNTGISAHISPQGVVSDATGSFQPATRTWTITRSNAGKTFYTRHGDLFVALCAAFSILMIATTVKKKVNRESSIVNR